MEPWNMNTDVVRWIHHGSLWLCSTVPWCTVLPACYIPTFQQTQTTFRSIGRKNLSRTRLKRRNKTWNRMLRNNGAFTRMFRISVPTENVSHRKVWKPGTGQNQGDRQSNFDIPTTDAGDRVRVKISPAERWSTLKNPGRAHAESAQDSHPRPTRQTEEARFDLAFR